MIAQLTFRIDTTSPQKATALRDLLASQLEDDEQVTLLAKNYAEDTEAPEDVVEAS